MSFVEDLTMFFTDFGVYATPSVGAPFMVIFDRAHIEALGGDISGTQPIALAASADVSALIAQTSTIVIAGADHHPPRAGDVTYLIVDVQPDGTGMTTLQLREDA